MARITDSENFDNLVAGSGMGKINIGFWGMEKPTKGSFYVK
jgi:hypothetical protein